MEQAISVRSVAQTAAVSASAAATRRPRPVRRRSRAKRALVYLRVSTFGQEKHGKNLEGQLDEVKEYCARKGYTLDPDEDVFRDIVSGARTDRVAYYQLLARIEREDAEVVLAWNVSRLGRNTMDGAWLMVKAKEFGFRIETAQEGMDFTADPASELVFDILTAAAKFQRNTILQDMMRGKKTGHKNGRWTTGAPPIGYTAKGPRGGKVLTPNADAALVREIFTRYANGETQLAIATDLRGRKVTVESDPRRDGLGWAANTIGRILKCPAYVGLLAFRGEVVKGLHQAIIDQDLWDRVQMRRAEVLKVRPGRPKKVDEDEE
jgi:site-specific DNA recombinase